MQTNAAGLIGRYTGYIAFATGGAATFPGEVVATDDGLTLVVTQPDCCPSCDCDTGPVHSQAAPLTAHDGWVDIVLDVNGAALSATLWSDRNQLRGSAQMTGDADGTPARDGLVPGGELTLTKLP